MWNLLSSGVKWSNSAALDVAMIREQRKSAAEDLCKNAEQIDAGKSKCGAFEKIRPQHKYADFGSLCIELCDRIIEFFWRDCKDSSA